MNFATPDKKLLEYLAIFGVAHYVPITDELLKLFNDLKDYRDFKRSDEGVIWQFLRDLQEHQFIKYRVTHYTEHGTPMIDAAIQPNGVEYLKGKTIENSPSNVYNFGDHAQIGQLSSSSVNSDIRLNTPQTKPNKETKTRKILKIISKVVVILVAIFGIIKGIIELTRHRKEDNKEISPKKSNDKQNPDSTVIISN